MGSHTLVLIMILGALCVAQALRCNYCKKINPDNSNCVEGDIEMKDCSSGFDTCLKIKMHSPAYGEVRRCAKAKECEVDLPPQVERHCCKTDLCN